MAKFNAGDIVRVKQGSVYPALDGMIFEVFESTRPASGHVAIDVTALHEIDSSWGWGTENGAPSEKIKGWYMQERDMELIAPARAFKRVPETVKPKRTEPLPPSALSPQCRQLLELLTAKGSVTALEAGGVYRIRALPRRIADLKEAGYTIVRDLTKDTTGQRYARYYIKGTVPQAVAA